MAGDSSGATARSPRNQPLFAGADLEKNTGVSNVSENLITHSGPPAAADPRQQPAQLRVLVVDGEPLIRWALSNALETCGHHVVAAADTDAALHALAGEDLDAAVLDCQLADAGDLTLLHDIRAIAPDLPVVGMTACPGEETMLRARGHGAVRILEKPFDVFSLDHVLRDVCARQLRP